MSKAATTSTVAVAKTKFVALMATNEIDRVNKNCEDVKEYDDHKDSDHKKD